MIQLQNVSKRYCRKGHEIVALRPTTLTIDRGEFVAVVGPSGSGKTTLLSVLGGMLAPSEGDVSLDGLSLYEATPRQRAHLRQRMVGFVFQTFNLIPYLTARENVQLPLLLSGESDALRQARVMELLARVGLESRLEHKPCELSVGQQQRVALARTLVNDPAIILADEPTGNLDPQTRQHVLDFLDEVHREARTVIMVTHDPAAAARAKRTLTLSEGAIVSDSKSSTRAAA